MLLSIEWLKVRRYRTFWIILGLFALMTPLGYYVLTLFINHESVGRLLSSAKTFEAIWHNTSFITSHFLVIVGLLMIVVTGNEYQFRTNRQGVIDGWSRMDFYHGKWQLVLGLSGVVVVFSFLYAVVAATLQRADFGGIGDGVISLLWLLLMSVNYIGIALVLTTLIRRTGLAVIIYIAYYMMVDNILHSVFILKLHNAWLDLMLPMETSDGLLPRPKGLDMRAVAALPPYVYAAGTLAWITVFYFIGRQKLLRSDW